MKMLHMFIFTVHVSNGNLKCMNYIARSTWALCTRPLTTHISIQWITRKKCPFSNTRTIENHEKNLMHCMLLFWMQNICFDHRIRPTLELEMKLKNIHFQMKEMKFFFLAPVKLKQLIISLCCKIECFSL